MEYIEIKEQIKQKLPVARDFGDSENLLELGLSSLTIMRLVNQWRKQGVKVSFGSLMENPTFEGWWALIQRSMKKKAGKKRAQESKITPEKDMKQPFPLTDVQYAYWVGRDEEQYLGGIDCHAYLEFDGENIEPERLEKAWNVLQYHHPMLRACFLDDGTQKILDKPYCEKIKVHDFSRMSSEEAEAMAVSVRERLSHRKLKIEEGEVAGIELTLFPENKARLHVDMALLVADVQSLQILLRDLASAYRGENLPKESKGWNFASYLERQKQEEGEERKNAEKYWKNRLEHLPKGPDLPLAKRPQEVEKTVFNRRIVRIEKEEWDHLQMRAKKYQTTPAMVLLTAYATVLERWSRNHRFLINIPFFNRKTEQQGLEDVIADFTTLLLLEIDCEGNPTFAELLDRIQKQLHEDMKYTAYSGVQVQRDLAQMYGDASAVAPVVFACNLGTPLVNDTFRKELGQFSYMISQTPQVWNDFQSYEDENGVQLTWDSVDKLFPENMIPDMLECFENLLHELGKKDWNQRFDVLPEKRKREIEDTARTGVPERVECLHWAGIILDIGAGTGKTTIEMANMICDKEIIALEPSAYMRTAFMARLMEHNEVKERISLLPIDVGKYSFRDKISGVMCMGVLGHLKRDEQEKLLYKLDKNLNINVPILIELLEPKFLVAPVGSRISVATQGRLRYETYITDIKQVGMDQWTWRLTYKVFCGKNIVSTVDSLMSWNYQSVEKILNQLTKMHFRTAKLSETLLLAIKAR